MVSDFANWSRRKLNISGDRKLFLSRNLRYYIFGLTFIISAFSGLTAFEYISPISIVAREIIFGLGMAWGVVLTIFLFDLFVVKNGWCGHICPLGAFYSLIGRFSIFRVKYDLEKCTSCMECKVVCPEKEVLSMVTKESSPIMSGECTLCGRCIEVCNDDALNFHIRNFGDKK
jgi:ferredoxin-type protein NapH